MVLNYALIDNDTRIPFHNSTEASETTDLKNTLGLWRLARICYQYNI